MQLKRWSLFEAVFGTVVGFIVSMLVQTLVITPVFQTGTTVGQDFLIVVIFTVLSVIRGYLVRRYFNYLHHRSTK